jgi:hypothetical protein
MRDLLSRQDRWDGSQCYTLPNTTQQPTGAPSDAGG